MKRASWRRGTYRRIMPGRGAALRVNEDAPDQEDGQRTPTERWREHGAGRVCLDRSYCPESGSTRQLRLRTTHQALSQIQASLQLPQCLPSLCGQESSVGWACRDLCRAECAARIFEAWGKAVDDSAFNSN